MVTGQVLDGWASALGVRTDDDVVLASLCRGLDSLVDWLGDYAGQLSDVPGDSGSVLHLAHGLVSDARADLNAARLGFSRHERG